MQRVKEVTKPHYESVKMIAKTIRLQIVKRFTTADTLLCIWRFEYVYEINMHVTFLFNISEKVFT